MHKALHMLGKYSLTPWRFWTRAARKGTDTSSLEDSLRLRQSPFCLVFCARARVYRIFTILVLACLMAGAACISAQGETTDAKPANVVTINNKAYVKGPKILLGDIAAIEGIHAAILAKIEIGNASSPGNSRRIDADLIKARIKNSCKSVDSLEVRGASSVQATTLSNTLSGHEMGKSLREFIESRMPWDKKQAVIEIDAPSDIVIAEGVTTIEWRAAPNYQFLGPGTFKGDVLIDGQLEKTVLGRVDMEAYGDVVIAVRAVARGKVLGPDDIETQRMALSRLSREIITKRDQVIGKVSKSSLSPGQIVTTRKVEAPKLVKRYQYVTVKTRLGGVVVTTLAKAKSDGRAGDRIVLLNAKNKEEFIGTVQKDGVVFVE